MEIKTKIRYLIICGYHIFTLLNYENNKNYKISYFSFNFDRKSTKFFKKIEKDIKIRKNIFSAVYMKRGHVIGLTNDPTNKICIAFTMPKVHFIKL